jgi:uncharacterized protein YkwD
MQSTSKDIARLRAFRQHRARLRGRMLIALALLGVLAASCAGTSAALSAPPMAHASSTTAHASAAAQSSWTQLVVRTPNRCANTGLRPSSANLSKIEAATFCLINTLRRFHHLHALRLNANLHAVAAGQASEMVLGDYFGDDNRAGQTPLQRIVASSYPHAARVSTAQNIGWGTGPDATPAAMVRAWTRSAPHLRIILTAGFRDIGIGVAPAVPSSVTTSARGATYTVEFGVRRIKHAPPHPSASTTTTPVSTPATSTPSQGTSTAPASKAPAGSGAASGTAGHATGTSAGLSGGTAG